jgi:hypothetical protein
MNGAAGAAPLIGGQPRQVALQVVSIDKGPVSVIELAVCMAKLAMQVQNVSVAAAGIGAGTERDALLAGDRQATLDVLAALEAFRTAALLAGADYETRRAAPPVVLECQAVNGHAESAAPVQDGSLADDGPAPALEGS